MYWTLELASYLSDAPWPATKDELIDYSIRTGAPLEVVENLQAIEDEGDSYDSIQEIWPGNSFNMNKRAEINFHFLSVLQIEVRRVFYFWFGLRHQNCFYFHVFFY